MAGDSKRLQPVIIKRIKKHGHAAHGGAWKIAYADFVTAMMAFFLLMWLMGSTTEGDRKGIAEYFSSPMKMVMQGGSKAGSGNPTSILNGGGPDITYSGGQVKRGEPDVPPQSRTMHLLRAEQSRAEQRQLETLKSKVQAKLAQNPRLAAMAPQIRLEMTRDGLRIQIVDEQNRPMFTTGSAIVQPYMRELLREIAQTLAEVPNRLTLEGHTDAQPYGGGERGYSNWELSSERANASRRELVAGGLPEDRVLRVQGLASSMLFDPSDPLNPQNRRISIIVMNREAEERFLRNSAELPQSINARDSSLSSVAPITPPTPSIRPRSTP